MLLMNFRGYEHEGKDAENGVIALARTQSTLLLFNVRYATLSYTITTPRGLYAC